MARTRFKYRESITNCHAFKLSDSDEKKLAILLEFNRLTVSELVRFLILREFDSIASKQQLTCAETRESYGGGAA